MRERESNIGEGEAEIKGEVEGKWRGPREQCVCGGGQNGQHGSDA